MATLGHEVSLTLDAKPRVSLWSQERKLDTALLIVGFLLLAAGVAIAPPILPLSLSYVGEAREQMLLGLRVLQGLSVALGILTISQAWIRLAHLVPTPLAAIVETSGHVYFWAILALATAIMVVPFLIYDVVRIWYTLPIGYNEGWNVLHTTRWLRGEPLYPSLGPGLPFTPVNYPPLSFLVVGFASRWTGSVLVTGRAIALASFIAVAVLITATIWALGSSRVAAVAGGLIWLITMHLHAGIYIGQYDPQMLGHVPSLTAMYMYVRWQVRLSTSRLGTLALLCSAGLLIKHLLIVVPITLAVLLFLTDRRSWAIFVGFVVLFGGLGVLGTWVMSDGNLLANMVDLDRDRSLARMSSGMVRLFIRGGRVVLMVPFIFLGFARRRESLVPLIYGVVALAIGALAAQGIGVNVNAWFDFFAAAALACGLAAANLAHRRPAHMRLLLSGLLVFSLFPLLPVALAAGTHYAGLRHADEAFRADASLLRSVDGPALVEDPLLAIVAGKDYLFDAFAGTQLMVSGRVPEVLLTAPLGEGYFRIVALEFNLPARRRELVARQVEGVRASLTERWTDNVLRAIDAHYVPYRPGRSSLYHFYLPREAHASGIESQPSNTQGNR